MKAKGLSIGAMVCGIIGVISLFIPYIFVGALPCGVVGIILAGVAMSKINKGAEGSKGMAIVGLVCGILVCAFGILALIIYACEEANSGSGVSIKLFF